MAAQVKAALLKGHCAQGRLYGAEQLPGASALLWKDLYIQLINDLSLPFTPDSLCFVLFYTLVFVSPQFVSSRCLCVLGWLLPVFLLGFLLILYF